MTFDTFHEREKWDEYYASTSPASEDETIQRFNQEFAQKVLELLPEGGNVLEMGSGEGWQSLALARSGKFQVTLLDFSGNALDNARKLFQRENLTADFILADAFEPGEGQYDLVFNAGVIEHYNAEQQTALLRSMAMRSSKYVIVLAPNRLCEWYWLWRVQVTAQASWPYGKEAPLIDLSQVMQGAGLNFIGQAFMGENWTEAFIKGISGMDEGLREIALEIHRSPLLSPPQKSYLVAALGSVQPIRPAPAGWGAPLLAEEPGQGHLIESVALTLSQIVQERVVQRQLKEELDQSRRQIDSLSARLDEIYNSTTWMLAQRLMAFQEKVGSNRFLAWLEKPLRSGARKAIRPRR